MKKLDNKGLTLIELIISIALVSVVMTFLYRLLADVQYDSDNQFFSQKNQEQKIEIVNYIQSLIRFDNSTNYVTSMITNSSRNRIVITLNNGLQYQIGPESDKKTITVYQTNSSTKVLRTWVLEQGTLGDVSCTTADSSPTTLYPVECIIPVYTLNNSNVKDNNNTIDDIKIAVLKGKRK